MPTYIGFSTQNANQPKTTNAPSGNDAGPGTLVKPVIFGKKYRLVDQALVIQDFVNSLNIRQGEKVGQPGYGTNLWSFVFEPNNVDTQNKLETEVRRIASLDPRMALNYVKSFPQDNGILIEVEMAVVPFNNATIINIFFNSGTNSASLQ